MIYASIGFLGLSQPFFYSLSHKSINEFIFWQALIAIPAAAYYATVPVMLANLFPINLRCTVLSVVYSVAASLSAGLAPLFSFMLVEKTGSAASPSILILILVTILITLIGIKHLKYKPGIITIP